MSILQRAVPLAEQALDQWLPPADEAPRRLHEAMRYSAMAAGKRIRPALALAACQAVVDDTARAETVCAPVMAAVELLHTYTLIHDDLPAMDNDDLRRGRPTCHKAFDEATAILAGDALLTLAFEAVATSGVAAVLCLARASGSRGVVGGQQEDLEAEGGAVDDPVACRARLERIHRRKTAALIRAACELGAIAGGADADACAILARYGETIGLAFQVQDDILDCTADAAALGKTPGKDAQAGKLTYVSVHGLDAARQHAEALCLAAGTILSPLGEAARDLAEVGRYVIERDR